MGYIKSILLTAFMLVVVSFAFSQNSNEKIKEQNQQVQVKQTPQVVHTVKSGGNVSQVTARVIELCNGDNQTAEKVVRHIKTEINPPIRLILKDEEFDQLPVKEQAGVMKESRVKELINQFK